MDSPGGDVQLTQLKTKFARPLSLVRWSSPAIGFVLVELVGLLVRLVILLTQAGVWYFPDSKAYVYALAYPQQTAPRPGAVSSFWYYLSFGNYHEHGVVVVQFVVGMLAIALLYDGLRRIVDGWWALGLAALYAALPILAVFERTIMSEALTLDFLIGFFWAACIAFTARTTGARLSLLVVAIISLACTVSIRTAMIVPGAGAATVCVLLWIGFELIDGHETSKILSCAVSIILCAAVFAVPLDRAMTRNQHVFGFRAINVMAGSFLASRWQAVLPCTSPLAKQAAVKAALLQLCHTKSTSRYPGYSMNLVWVAGKPVFDVGRLGPSFAQNQRELGAVTQKALLAHPSAVVASVLSASLDELFGPLFVNVAQYDNGYQIWVHQGEGNYRAVLLAWTQRTAAPGQGTLPVFSSIVNVFSKAAQVLFWLVLLGGLYRLTRFIRFGRTHQVMELDRASRRTRRARLGLGSIAWVFVLGNVVSTAASAFASFRYDLVLLPALMVLLSVTWSGPPQREAPLGLDTGPSGDANDGAASMADVETMRKR